MIQGQPRKTDEDKCQRAAAHNSLFLQFRTICGGLLTALVVLYFCIMRVKTIVSASETNSDLETFLRFSVLFYCMKIGSWLLSLSVFFTRRTHTDATLWSSSPSNVYTTVYTSFRSQQQGTLIIKQTILGFTFLTKCYPIAHFFDEMLRWRWAPAPLIRNLRT